MNRNHLLAAACLPLALLLTQCDRVQSLFSKPPPKPTPYDFTFTLELTPEAAARMTREAADFHVTAYFYGLATPENRAQGDEMNRIRLGYQETYHTYGVRRIRIIASELDPKNLALSVDKKANVFVTVSDSLTKDYDRKKGEVPPLERMIECDGYTGPIDLAQAHPPVVHCDVWHP